MATSKKGDDSSKRDENNETMETAEKAAPAKTKEQKILDYIEASKESPVDLTPYLKSLYPMTTFNEPKMYQNQSESKRLRIQLDKMRNDGLITFYDEGYQNLGRVMPSQQDPNGNATKNQYYTIENTKILVNK